MRVSNLAKDLVAKMLEKNQDLRIGINEVLNHEWFNLFEAQLN
jgi:hypothetical protein